MFAKVILVFIIIGFTAPAAPGQPPQSFSRNLAVPVVISDTLKNPWAGGHNFCQLSPIDLNDDGIKDLFVFDRTGFKVTTYINNGTPGILDYTYAPEYAASFPAMLNWALLRDYNCDGREDIFTLDTKGGIAVFRNDYSIQNGLQFTPVTTMLLTDYGNIITNIYASAVDLPAFADVDNDGDLDVLNFPVSGSSLEYHKNLSKETYGHCDSLLFRFETGCWGKFEENATTNDVTLDYFCPRSSGEGGARHAGSTVMAFDVDKDGDKELLIGDISFANTTFLFNGGTTDTAYITAQDPAFPAYDVPVQLPVFPASFYLDVNNDNKNDLLVSPFAANISENFKSIWYYENTSITGTDTFRYRTNQFLINEMIDVGEGAYPVLHDYDQDGDEDLFIGNSGYYTTNGNMISQVALFINTGSNASPVFVLQTRDFAGLSANNFRNIAPAFGDLDGDFDADMVIGEFNGKLHYYENTAGPGAPASYTLKFPDYFGIDVGQSATPQLVDVNRDGKLDLLIGERSGTLNYAENTGTVNNPQFTTLKEQFGGVNVTATGFVTGSSNPFMYDDKGKYTLIVGSEKGNIFLYDNIDGNLNGSFNLLTADFDLLREGVHTAVSGKDMNADGFLDIIIGNLAGGVSYFSGTEFTSVREKNDEILRLLLYPNPATENVTIVIPGAEEISNEILIYDYTGKIAEKIVIRGNRATFSTSHLSNGFYIISAQSGKLTANEKLIIHH